MQIDHPPQFNREPVIKPALEFEPHALAQLDRVLSRSATCTVETFSVAGLLGGVKPGSLIESDVPMSQELVDLGFYCVQIESDEEGMPENIVASLDPAIAIELAALLVPGYRSDSDYRTIGKLLGNPETATDYFLKRIKSSSDSTVWLPMVEPKQLQGTVTGEFHQFILSPENYQEEIDAFIKPIERAAEQLLPRSYRVIERTVQRKNASQRIGRALRVGTVPQIPSSSRDGYNVIYVE